MKNLTSLTILPHYPQALFYGIAAWPASVILPAAISRWQRVMLRSVQWLRFCRGDSRWARRPSCRRFTVLSIHPKHVRHEPLLQLLTAAVFQQMVVFHK